MVLEDYLKDIIITAVDQCDDAILITDADTDKILYANKTWTDIRGHEASEIIGKSVSVIQNKKLDKKIFEEIYNSTITKGKWEGEIEDITSDGKIIPVYLKTTLVKKEGKNPIIIGITRDITQKKEYEKNLIAEREKAEKANESKSKFLAYMSHEIKHPLTALICLADLLQSPESEEEKKSHLQSLFDSTHRLNKLINDVLDYSKLKVGELKPTIKKTELYKELKSVMIPYVIIKDKKIISNFEELKNISYETDPFIIKQILNNLVSNANKFTNQGEIKINATRKPINNIEELVILTVEDSGIGIPLDMKDKIFESYIQAHNDHKHKGAGLGLAITKKYLELLNGNITVDSEEGKGSTFKIELILNRYYENNQKRILIAERDDGIIQLYRHILLKQNKDYLIEDRFSGEKAFEDITKTKYDLLITGILLEGEINGLTLINQIRAYEEKYKIKKIPIITITACTEPNIEKKCLLTGANNFIQKPIIDYTKFENTLKIYLS